jgi:hypothetical protein
MSDAAKTLTVRVPLVIRKRGGRRLVLAPDGSVLASRRTRVDDVMVKAVARAFRWQKLIEGGACNSIEEVAAAEQISASYVGRLLRLTLLAPDIVEGILDGQQASEVTLARLMKPFPEEWKVQLGAIAAKR